MTPSVVEGPHRLVARTADSHSANQGSIPCGVTDTTLFKIPRWLDHSTPGVEFWGGISPRPLVFSYLERGVYLVYTDYLLLLGCEKKHRKKKQDIYLK